METMATKVHIAAPMPTFPIWLASTSSFSCRGVSTVSAASFAFVLPHLRDSIRRLGSGSAYELGLA